MVSLLITVFGYTGVAFFTIAYGFSRLFAGFLGPELYFEAD